MVVLLWFGSHSWIVCSFCLVLCLMLYPLFRFSYSTKLPPAPWHIYSHTQPPYPTIYTPTTHTHTLPDDHSSFDERQRRPMWFDAAGRRPQTTATARMVAAATHSSRSRVAIRWTSFDCNTVAERAQMHDRATFYIYYINQNECNIKYIFFLPEMPATFFLIFFKYIDILCAFFMCL